MSAVPLATQATSATRLVSDIPNPAVTTSGLFPLSLMQESLWVLDQIAPGTSAYNLPEAWLLSGALDVPALERAVQTVFERHEALRTIFGMRGGKPVQLVLPAGTALLEKVDATGTSGLAQLRAMVSAAARQPFVLSRGPLARFTLFRVGEGRHVFLLNLHHIISDEWSVAILLRELRECYAAQLEVRPPRLPELPIQYADFAAWQRERMADSSFEPQLEYWKRQLGGVVEPVSLPADRRRPAVRSFEGSTSFFELPEKLATGLDELGRSHGATRFMVMLAAFELLLQRYSRQDDIVVGSPMAARERVETEGVVGFFVNTHALRTNLSGDPTFIELLARTRETVLGAYAHQEISLDKVLDALQPERTTNRHPLFDIVFGWQSVADTWDLPGLTTERWEVDNGGAKFDLTVLVTELGGNLGLRCEYSTGLFEVSTIRRLVGHFQTLLESILADPSRHISEFAILPEAEQRELLSAWNPAPVDSVAGECLHRWFERQAAQAPQATAVVHENECLSYGALNRQANELARHLRQLGVGPEVPVGLYLERSASMLVAILAVLKAGGYYVPIDPASPAERMEFILRDTAAPVVITQRKFNLSVRAKVVLVEEHLAASTTDSGENPSYACSPAHTAYLIYTSGSTGKPKGVQVTHQNVTRLFAQTEKWFGFGPSDVWTLFHSYTFDFSVWEMWGALLYGGKLVVVPYLVSRAPGEFYELLAREKVTVLNQTPSAFRQLIAAEACARGERPANLRYVICGGEALELSSLKPWFEVHGDERPRVVNMYGITETTVHVTYRVIRAADVEEGKGSVIGVPIPDLRLYLLDSRLRPVPLGVPGEICVGGAGVARGYLNRPELTAQRFVPDPFSRAPGDSLYRSGDLARYTAQGEMEYLGRMDDQVKIRGFRVELGEISSALALHPEVRENVIVALDGPGGSKQLVAYLVPAGVAPSTADLRAFLAQKLPEHMVPSAFITLPSLPLNNNGKVDRKSLPSPKEFQARGEGGGAPPETPLQKLVAETWCSVLNRTSVGLEDHFFHLGGHSLLATQVIARLSASLKADLSVRLLFEAPTVKALSEAIQQAQKEQADGAAAIPRRHANLEARELLARLDELTPAEIDALLAEGRALSA